MSRKEKGEDSGVNRYWVSAWWKQQGESVETVERVVGGLLFLGVNSW